MSGFDEDAEAAFNAKTAHAAERIEKETKGMSNVLNGLKCEVTVDQAYPKGAPNPGNDIFVEFSLRRTLGSDEYVLMEGGYALPPPFPISAPNQPRIIMRRKSDNPKCPHCDSVTGMEPMPHGMARKFCGDCGEALPKYDPTKPRRWEVEFTALDGPTVGLHCKVSRILREVKPITRKTLCDEMFRRDFSGEDVERMKVILKELGIEVED